METLKVEVVRFFNGDRSSARIVGRTSALSGVCALERKVRACGPGWGCEVRGSREALEAIGVAFVDHPLAYLDLGSRVIAAVVVE